METISQPQVLKDAQWQQLPQPSHFISTLYKEKFWERFFGNREFSELVQVAGLGIVSADLMISSIKSGVNAVEWIPNWAKYSHVQDEPNFLLMGVDGAVIEFPGSASILAQFGLGERYLQSVATDLGVEHWHKLSRLNQQAVTVQTGEQIIGLGNPEPHSAIAHRMVVAALDKYLPASENNSIIVNVPDELFSKKVRNKELLNIFGEKDWSVSAYEFVFFVSRMIEAQKREERLPILFVTGLYDFSKRLSILKGLLTKSTKT